MSTIPDLLRNDAPSRPAAYLGDNLVFIVGCSRSGTTWLQRLLASHPDVRTGQESHVFNHYIAPQLRSWRYEMDKLTGSDARVGRGGLGLPCYFREAEFVEILRQYMLALLNPMVGALQPGQLFVEKTPPHALFLAEIKELLPHSRIIHVLRDGRDVVASMLAASRSWGSKWAPRWPHTAARSWVTNVQAVREAASKFTADEFREVRYEVLRSEPGPVLKDLSRFLGLSWADEDIAKAIAANQAGSPNPASGTRIPLGGEAAAYSRSTAVKDPAGFVRRGQAGTWRQDLSPAEKFLTWFHADRLLRQTGYVSSWRDWL